jgi:hypothetical protein
MALCIEETNLVNVLVVKSKTETILTQGVESLLSGMQGVHLKRLAARSNAEWMRTLEAFQPDVIILFEAPQSRGLHQLEKALFETRMPAYILLISEGDNRLYRIEKQPVQISSIADFVRLLSPSETYGGIAE